MLRQDAIAKKSHDDHYKYAKLLQERVNQRLKVLAVLISMALLGLLLLAWELGGGSSCGAALAFRVGLHPSNIR